MKTVFTLLILTVSLAFGAKLHAQNSAKHRIIIQVTSGDTAVWKSAIGNIKNLKTGWGADAEIELVAHGPGIGFLLTAKTTQHEAIKMLKAQGVVFVTCENTLRERKISKSEVMPESGFVPMGVGEIVMKQEAGWSYIKAGF